jgi:hypothetical protein
VSPSVPSPLHWFCIDGAGIDTGVCLGLTIGRIIWELSMNVLGFYGALAEPMLTSRCVRSVL